VRKHLPNILLLTVVLANLFFMALYIKDNGFGKFLSTTGIILLAMGVIIFIYFLSIDPGYGWIRSIDLRRNYIMIFTSMAVCMFGVVLIVSGQQMDELRTQSIHEAKRCRELIAGNAEEVMRADWYSLKDRQHREPVSVFLFQKKSDRNHYRIIAMIDQPDASRTISSFTITSDSVPIPITVDRKDTRCPDVFEQDISIDFETHQRLNEQVRFDLRATLLGRDVAVPRGSGQDATVQFTLQNKPGEAVPEPQAGTQVGTKMMKHGAFSAEQFLPWDHA